MLKIRVPATSANLSVGFDTLGIALSIYNEFGFEKSSFDNVDAFESKFRTNNLVLKSYKRFLNIIILNMFPLKSCHLELISLHQEDLVHRLLV